MILKVGKSWKELLTTTLEIAGLESEGHVALRDFVLGCIAKSEEDNRTREVLRFSLKSQGSLDHRLKGIFVIVIKNVCGCQHRRSSIIFFELSSCPLPMLTPDT